MKELYIYIYLLVCVFVFQLLVVKPPYIYIYISVYMCVCIRGGFMTKQPDNGYSLLAMMLYNYIFPFIFIYFLIHSLCTVTDVHSFAIVYISCYPLRFDSFDHYRFHSTL